jgi:(p)ppGpp synthase/HD superfamily hydrolase
MEVMACIAMEANIDDPDLAVQCALLHDTIEDTDAEYDLLCREFGAAVADGVLALSKDASIASRHERMRDSLARIKQQPREIWIVKLADRISNLQPPPGHWTEEKIADYKAEAQMILDELGDASEVLGLRLRQKIEGYV